MTITATAQVPTTNGHGHGPTPDRIPPNDTAAEQCVLGGMLLSADAIGQVVEFLRTVDFYRPAHATIYDAILTLYNRGEPVDPMTVTAALARTGDTERTGGAPYLHTLVNTVPVAANAGYYARRVRELSDQRHLIALGTRITQIGFEGPRDTDDNPLDRAGALFFDAVAGRTTGGVVSPAALVRETLEEIGSDVQAGLMTGFADLDRLLNGLHPGQLLIIAGRPGMGKSVIGMDIARSVALRQGHAVQVCNLEMSRVEVMKRVLSAETRIPFIRLRDESLAPHEWAQLTERGGAISEAPLFVDDSPGQTLTTIRASARRMKQRHNIKLIVVDYLQLMTSGRRVESRQQEVSDLSRGLKLLAKELEVPVVAISQLNRGPEQRTDKRPQLSDLRESGSLEQDPDVVILLHRDDYYDKESPRAGEADFIVAKHRNGPTDTITVAAQLHTMRFVDMAI